MLVMYFIGRILNNSNIISYFHIIWGIVMIFSPILTKNKLLLCVHLTIILITLATRKIFNGCMVRIFEDKDNIITNNEFTKIFNWDMIFPVLGFISIVKLYRL